MVNILNSIISKLKKEEYRLDENIKLVDIFSIVSVRFASLLRGLIRRIGFNACGKVIFIGRHARFLHKKRISVGNGVTFGNYTEINALSRDGVIIGDNVNIGDYSVIRCTGSLKQIGKGLIIGSNCGIGDYCFFGAAGGIEIKDNVIMGQNIRFHSENHNFNDVNIPIRMQGVTHKGIFIDEDCWIGAGTVFLDGVRVGKGCVIGANTIVNKDIPAYSVAVGNPVKIIKNRFIKKN